MPTRQRGRSRDSSANTTRGSPGLYRNLSILMTHRKVSRLTQCLCSMILETGVSTSRLYLTFFYHRKASWAQFPRKMEEPIFPIEVINRTDNRPCTFRIRIFGGLRHITFRVSDKADSVKLWKESGRRLPEGQPKESSYRRPWLESRMSLLMHLRKDNYDEIGRGYLLRIIYLRYARFS